MQLTKNFSKKELECKCGCGKCVMNPLLLSSLQLLRDKIGKPIKITSGYRCSTHNAKVGGAVSSQHLQGNAVDISIDGMTIEDFQRLIMMALQIPAFKGYGFHKMFMHLDTRNSPQVISWHY